MGRNGRVYKKFEDDNGEFRWQERKPGEEAPKGPERQFVTERIENSPGSCSYCGRPTGDTSFLAASLDAKSVICHECLGKYAVLKEVGRLRRFYSLLVEQGQDLWPCLEAKMTTAVDFSWAPKEYKDAVVAVAMRIARRNASSLAGWRQAGYNVDPRMRDLGMEVCLAPARIALVGERAKDCLGMLRAAAGAGGSQVVSATADQVESGRAGDWLLDACMQCDFMADVGTIFVTGDEPRGRTPHNVVYAGESCPAGFEAFEVGKIAPL